MEKKRIRIFSMQPDLECFIPATDEEKSYIVTMRPSTTFFKDGVKRFKKNKVAVASLIIIALVTLIAVFLPIFWPYSYDAQLGVSLGKNPDGSYNNLHPMEYGSTEMKQVEIYNLYKQWKKADVFVSESEFNAARNEKMDKFIASGNAELNALLEEKAAVENSNYSDEVKAADLKKIDKNIEKLFAGWLKENKYETGYATFSEYKSAYNLWNVGEKAKKPFPHFFGTDAAGRDYVIRVVYGTRISLVVGFFASIIVLLIGLTIGSLAGYCGGKVDLYIMRLVDIIYSLPDMLMIILLASVLKVTLAASIEGTFLAKIGSNIISLFIVFGLLYWVGMARLIRGQILSLREQEYVLAAKAAGAKGSWIIKKHLLPNCMSVVFISTALQIPSAIFTESYLSFLGLGVNAPMPSLGSLASDALDGVISYSYRLIIPAIAISLIVLSLNLLGDGLRDAFDPKLND